MDAIDHEKTFQLAWDDPANTRYELPPVPVNEVLAAQYLLDRPLVFTRTMLWDMERRKARRPDLYIPYVVAPGSAESWGEGDVFVRRSNQRRWLDPQSYGLVLEQTKLDDTHQVVTFIGAAEAVDGTGELLRAGTGQPIFHVEHSVRGSANEPLNCWRIVLLTDGPDDRFTPVFRGIASIPWLPEFIEIYIRDVLGIGIEHRTDL